MATNSMIHSVRFPQSNRAVFGRHQYSSHPSIDSTPFRYHSDSILNILPVGIELDIETHIVSRPLLQKPIESASPSILHTNPTFGLTRLIHNLATDPMQKLQTLLLYINLFHRRKTPFARDLRNDHAHI